MLAIQNAFNHAKISSEISCLDTFSCMVRVLFQEEKPTNTENTIVTVETSATEEATAKTSAEEVKDDKVPGEKRSAEADEEVAKEESPSKKEKAEEATTEKAEEATAEKAEEAPKDEAALSAIEVEGEKTEGEKA